MSLRALEIMVARSVTSDQFRKGIMNGRRAELLQEYHLEPDEFAEVMAIQAGTATEFYAAVDQILTERDPHGRVSGRVDLRGEFARKLGAIHRAASKVALPA